MIEAHRLIIDRLSVVQRSKQSLMITSSEFAMGLIADRWVDLEKKLNMLLYHINGCVEPDCFSSFLI
jgi:hypothetical protein